MEDLVHQAERLTAEITGSGVFPGARVERNLKQLAETGNDLWSRTVAAAGSQSSSSSSSRPSSAQVSASILLGSRGYDLTKATQQLDSLSARKHLQPAPRTVGQADGTTAGQQPFRATTGQTLAADAADAAVSPADPAVQSFLKSERESAILSAVQQVKRTTFDQVDAFFWQSLHQEWQEEKMRILRTTLRPEPQSDQSMDQTMLSVGTPLVRDTSRAAGQEDRPEPRKVIDSVLQLMREGKSYDHITGCIQSDGCRTHGSLDKLRPAVDIDSLIEEMAGQAEKEAFLEEAVKLYDMAGAQDKALDILNQLLSGIISRDPTSCPDRERMEQMALSIAERYAMHGHSASKSTSGTFFLLLDLMTFFTYYHRSSFHDALDTISKLDVVPLTQSQLDPLVQDFRKLSIHIQRNVPDILVACMNILYAMFREAKVSQNSHSSVTYGTGRSPGLGGGSPGQEMGSSGRDQRLQDLRHKARTLITFAGMIPYRMAADVNAKLVQLEVLMS